MKQAAEFVFDRPSKKESKLMEGQIGKYESFLQSLAEKNVGMDESSLQDSVVVMNNQIGTQATLALLYWGLVSLQVKRGEPVSANTLQKAISETAAITAKITPGRISTPGTRLMALLLTNADFVASRARDHWAALMASCCADHVRIIAEANAGNVVYRDPFLLVSWRSGFGAWQPELFVCTFNSKLNIYTYLPQSLTSDTNLVPPISSFKAARAAVQNWRGRQLSGELVGSVAIRLCSILGIEVQGDKGCIKGNQKRASGF